MSAYTNFVKQWFKTHKVSSKSGAQAEMKRAAAAWRKQKGVRSARTRSARRR